MNIGQRLRKRAQQAQNKQETIPATQENISSSNDSESHIGPELSEETKKELKKFFVSGAASRSGSRSMTARRKIAIQDIPVGCVMMHIGSHDAPEGPSIAWADDKNTYASPSFEKLSLPMQCGIEMHEMQHVMRRHIPRSLAMRAERGDRFSMELGNFIADCLINESMRLVFLESASPYYTLPDKTVYLVDALKTIFGEEWNAKEAVNAFDYENLYTAIAENRPPLEGSKTLEEYKENQKNNQNKKSNKQQNQGPGNDQEGDQGDPKNDPNGTDQSSGQSQDQGKKPSDADSEAAKRAIGYARSQNWEPDMAEPEDYDQNSAESIASEQDWRYKMEQARQLAENIQRTTGSGSNSIMRYMGNDAAVSRTPWRNVLRNLVASEFHRKPHKTKRTLPRRFISMSQVAQAQRKSPPISPNIEFDSKVGRIVVINDTSGSIDDRYLAPFYAEWDKIRKQFGSTMEIIMADDRVHSVTVIKPSDPNDALKNIKFKGHGGTDFAPAMRVADRKDVSVIVYLTDLCGPCNYRPKNVKKVIWAVPRTLKVVQTERPAFGHLLELDF